MERIEYEILQEAFRKKLHRKDGYLSGNKEEIYREGIRAAMSILSNHQAQYEKKHNEGSPAATYTQLT